jgi:TatD DNase family protein
MLIDSHCHLDFPDFAEDCDAVVARALAAGIGRMVTVCTTVARFAHIRALAERYQAVFCSVGTHPHQAGEEPDVAVDTLVELARYEKCVAIGEAGLDYHYDRAPRAVAAKVFRTQIAAARASGLPLIIHTRDADADMANILEEEMRTGEFAAVLHCFTASKHLAETGISLGFYVSFSGVLTFRNAADLRAIARILPLDRLLVETDAPYLAPVPYRGKRNEPAYVAQTARALAAAKSLEVAEIAAATTANVLRLFAKMPPMVG